MRLTWKLVAVFALGMLLLSIAFDAHDIRNDVVAEQAQLSRTLLQTARGVGSAVEDLERLAGREAVSRFIAERNAHGQSSIRRLSAAELGSRLSPNERERLGREGVLQRLIAPEKKSGHMVIYQLLQGGDVLEVAQSLERMHAQIRDGVTAIIWQSVLLFLLAAVCVLLLGAVFVARPVGQLIEFARRVGDGDLSQRIALTRRDELAELAETMNTMCQRLADARAQITRETNERIRTVEQLRHADRLKTVGQLAAGIAHELGTPLNVVGGHAKMITTGESSPQEIQESAHIILDQTAHITAVIRQLLDFARPNKPVPSDVDLAELARHTAHLLGHLASERRVKLVLADPLPATPVRVDAGQIRQALTNLIVNALQAVSVGKSVTVQLRVSQAVGPGGGSRRDFACLAVQDEGPGVSPEDLPRLFDPFFTTKPVGEGSGLGLSVARGIVEENGGFIDVQSTQGQGSCFSIYLPLAKQGASE
ncbi:MAG TPA: ATP-binding protein [Pseudomonadota bacterium]|nr:ATP-binding protein [Pseudomonadota bacterium]